MPSNLFEFQNQFRLVDVKGIVLDNPDDYIIIREPTGFSESKITLKRDDDNHGFDFEYTDAEVTYDFSKAMKGDGETINPYNFLLDLYTAEGVDADCIFQFLNYNEGTLMYDVQFEANLDFNTLVVRDYNIGLLARRVDFGDVFRTRIETPVDFGKNETIDGDPMPVIAPEEVFLHSKLSIQDVFTSNDTVVDLVRNFSDPVFTAKILFLDSDGFLFDDGSKSYTEIILGELDGSLIGQPAERPSVTQGVVFWNGWNALNVDLDPYTVKVTSTYTIDLTNNGGVNDLLLWVGFLVKDFDQDLDDAVWLGRNEYTVNPLQSLSLTDTIDGDITINPEDAVGKDLYFATARAADFGTFDATITDITYNAEREVIAENSTAEFYESKDSINRVLYSITGQSDAVVSTFFDNDADKMYLTNGYKVRKFQDRDMIVSFDDLFKKWAQPVYGLGRAITGDTDFTLLIERYEFFYQDVEIDYIDTIQDGTYEGTIDTDIVFNEVVIGYKDFPKSTDENKAQNLDEYNSQQNLIMPISMTKKKKTYESELITSGYLIENMRIEQFKEVPQETVSNDEKIFCVSCINSDTYNYVGNLIYASGGGENNITVDGVYYDIRIGDVLVFFPKDDDGNDTFTVNNIQRSSGVSGVKTILTVDEIVSDESWIGQQVTITLPEVRLRAERNDNMETLGDVISPETVYNIGLNPKYMLFNQSPIINSGLNPKPDTAVIKTQEAKLNTSMNCQFKAGEGDYVLGGDAVEVSMDGDLQLSDINGNTKLFSGLIHKFTANITYQRLLAIRDAYLYQSLNSDNYGYLRFKSPSGEDITGFLMELGYNPMSQQAEFKLRGKFVE